MEALRNFSSCLQRQVNEAVGITPSKAYFILNSKSEFHQAPIVRVTVAAGLEREQGEEDGAGVRVAKGGQVEPEAGEQGEGGQGEPESEEQGEERQGEPEAKEHGGGAGGGG